MPYTLVRSASDLRFVLEKAEFSLHQTDEKDLFSKVYVSKLEKRKDYAFLVLEQPDYDKERRQFSVKEVAFIVSKKQLLIYDPEHSRYIDQFFSEVRKEEYAGLTPSALCIAMLDFFSLQMYRAIPKFSREVAELEVTVLNESDERDMVHNIQNIKRNLIIFESVLDPISDVNTRLLTVKQFSQTEKAQDVLVEYTERISKVLKSVKNFERLMNVLSASNEAQEARKTNKGLGVLTLLNALLLLPPIAFYIWETYHVRGAGWLDSSLFVLYLGLLSVAVVLYLKRQKIIA